VRVEICPVDLSYLYISSTCTRRPHQFSESALCVGRSEKSSKQTDSKGNGRPYCLPACARPTLRYPCLPSVLHFILHCLVRVLPLSAARSGRLHHKQNTFRDCTAIMCLPPSSGSFLRAHCTPSIATLRDAIWFSYVRHTGHRMRVTDIITRLHVARQTRLVPMCFQPHLSIVNDDSRMPLPPSSPVHLPRRHH
jgi:hypothetical protein